MYHVRATSLAGGKLAWIAFFDLFLSNGIVEATVSVLSDSRDGGSGQVLQSYSAVESGVTCDGI